MKSKLATKKIAVLAGDGIGPEIVAEAVKVLKFVNTDMNLGLVFDNALVGGAAYDAFGTPLPQQRIERQREGRAHQLVKPCPGQSDHPGHICNAHHGFRCFHFTSSTGVRGPCMSVPAGHPCFCRLARPESGIVRSLR